MLIRSVFCIACFFAIGALYAGDTTYYKGLIKNRSRYQPKKYNYAVIRDKHALKYVKNRKFNPNSRGGVYNYVEIKNVHQSLIDRNVNNIGLSINKKNRYISSHDKIVNIVKIKNSSINGNALTGVKIKTKKHLGQNRVNIVNSVNIKKSDVGSRTNRLMYKAYKFAKGIK